MLPNLLDILNPNKRRRMNAPSNVIPQTIAPIVDGISQAGPAGPYQPPMVGGGDELTTNAQVSDAITPRGFYPTDGLQRRPDAEVASDPQWQRSSTGGFYPGAQPAATATEGPQELPLQYEAGHDPRMDPRENAYNRQGKLLREGAEKEDSFLKRALMGALRGFGKGGLGGAIAGTAIEGFYPDANTHFRTQKELGEVNQEIAGLEQQRTSDQKFKLGETQVANTLEDNARMAADLERKRVADASKAKYWERKADQGDLKLAGDEELRALRDKWAESKSTTDKRRLDLVEKEMGNRMDRAEKDRSSREKIAGMRESGVNRRQQITIEAQKEAAAVRAAEAKGNAAEAAAARERLAKLKAEYNQQ